MIIKSYFHEPSPNIVDNLLELAGQVFQSVDEHGARWRLDQMPDLSVFLAMDGGKLVGFKIGHAATYNRYYSWLGGVHPDYRGQGIAGELMRAQHDWLATSRFQRLETHVVQANRAMVGLNQQHGFKVTGLFLKGGERNYVMQKTLKAT